MSRLAEIRDEYDFLDDRDDRHRLLIDLGRALESMPDALKTDSSRVIGCQSKVWTYPIKQADGTLHFFADSDSALTKGIIALILETVQDRTPEDILVTQIETMLLPFDLEKHFTSKRTSGLANMIDLIRATAARYSAA